MNTWLRGTVRPLSLIYKCDIWASASSPTETTLWFFEVKSNYCSSASVLTLCVRLCTRASERARLCTPIKTPSDEHDTGDVEQEQAAQPRFHLLPFKLRLTWKVNTRAHVSRVWLCQKQCYIFNGADLHSHLSAYTGVLNKKQLFDVFVWVSVMLCDRVWSSFGDVTDCIQACDMLWMRTRARACLSFKCVIIQFAANTLTDGCTHISVSDEPVLF